MRLQLTILRHGLPATRILWTVRSDRPLNTTYGNEGCTIAQLLEEVNEVVPLETSVDAVCENEDTGGQWGLEDYVVEVNGFECLHFLSVDALLREGDEVVIRALGVGDIRARRLSGRLQVSTDGRRLIDGVAFGRPYLQRSYSSRPPIRIPPRKRRRTTLGWTGNLEDEQTDTQLALYDDASVMDSEHGTVIRHPRTLFEDDGDEDHDEDEEDMDYEEDPEELAEELKSLRDEAHTDVPFFDTPDFKRFRSGRLSRMAHRDPLPSSSPARPSIVSTPRTNLTKGVDGEASVKSTKSVHFEAYTSNSDSQLSESESDSDEDMVAEASSDTHDSSAESSDEDFSAEESDSDDSSASEDSNQESNSESEDEGLPRKNISKTIDVFTPPGAGNRKTRNSNRRKKLRSRLAKLKSLGELPPEANFDDLKKWQAENGKAPLTEVIDVERKREARTKELSEIEIKRQQLLRDLASGGVEVDGHSEKENIPPRYRNEKQKDVQESPEKIKGSPATTVTLEAAAETPNELEKSSPTDLKRRKLDLSSTKRLLFGSLGVRTPQTKEDEEMLRKKLDASRSKPVALEKITEISRAESEKEVDENWQEKIVLSATECFYDDIELTAPPFPFKQRWDSDANYAIRQRKNNNNKKNKKRKQRDWQEDEANESYQDTTLNDNEADGGVALNYNDPPVSALEEKIIQKENQEFNVNGDADDLPELPRDVTALPVMTDNEVTVGSIIAFKHLLMSKATNWQPQISDYKVARIDKIYDNGTFDMILAKRDREVSEQTEVDEDGVRNYSGFEMPDDEDDVEDDGLRSVTFADLLEPKVIKAAVLKELDQSQPIQKKEVLTNGKDETSLLNHPPTPSAPVVSAGSNAASVDEVEAQDKGESNLPPPLATPSSQTRLTISHMIHDAGFRSTIDSELDKEPVVLGKFGDKSREDSAIEIQSKAAGDDKGADSNSEEFASSPPDIENRHDEAEESQVMDQGDDTAMDDVDDAGFQMDAEDDFVMDDQNSQAGDSSDDSVSLPQNDIKQRHDKKLSADETASSKAGENPDSQPSSENPWRIVKQEFGQQRAAEAERLYQSTAVRGNTRSFTEPAVLDTGGYGDDDDDASEYVDAYSAVSNPLTKRDMAAMKREKPKPKPKPKPKATSEEEDLLAERSSFNMPKSNQEANNVTDYAPGSAEEKNTNNKIDFDLSFLDDNREESEDSDVDFPDIEVLWASTAPTQKEFSPIKMESETAGHLPKSSARQSGDNESPVAEPDVSAAKDTSAVQQRQPEPSQQQTVGESSSRSNVEEPANDDYNNNADNGTQSPSPFVPDLEFGGSQHGTNDIDNADQYQHSADNSSHPDFQPQDQQDESQDHPIPMVDLTVSSPLVSPDDSDDEDFARSKGLPRGPGWVKKNVPETRRQTRSSTGGAIMLSSSVSPQPARTRRGGRLFHSQY